MTKKQHDKKDNMTKRQKDKYTKKTNVQTLQGLRNCPSGQRKAWFQRKVLFKERLYLVLSKERPYCRKGP